MLSDLHLPLILLAALMAIASPGPATLAIAGTALDRGRGAGIALALGVSAGSLVWALAAAFGLGALMRAHGEILGLLRWVGAGYLGWLAWKSGRAALRGGALRLRAVAEDGRGRGRGRDFARGLMIHLTNPKPILFFGALFSVGVPPDTPARLLGLTVAAIWLQGLVVVLCYATLFSIPRVSRGYQRFRRWFDGLFALAFAAAGLRLLTARLG